jgi:DNA-binding NarL/FixJ family response regulator
MLALPAWGMGEAMSTAMKTACETVLIVDDHQTFADLLEVAIEREPDLQFVGAADSVESALAQIDLLEPDLVVMDYQLGDGDGISATAVITREHPDVRVVILTAHAQEDLIRRSARAGACCLLPKSGSLPDLLQGLRTASKSGFVVHPGLLKTLVSEAPPDQYVPPLSRREEDVLELLATGMDVRSVADNLGITLSTCRGYVKGLLLKLNAHSQLEAVVTANRLGLTHGSRVRRPA